MGGFCKWFSSTLKHPPLLLPTPPPPFVAHLLGFFVKQNNICKNCPVAKSWPFSSSLTILGQDICAIQTWAKNISKYSSQSCSDRCISISISPWSWCINCPIVWAFCSKNCMFAPKKPGNIAKNMWKRLLGTFANLTDSFNVQKIC